MLFFFFFACELVVLSVSFRHIDNTSSKKIITSSSCATDMQADLSLKVFDYKLRRSNAAIFTSSRRHFNSLLLSLEENKA